MQDDFERRQTMRLRIAGLRKKENEAEAGEKRIIQLPRGSEHGDRLFNELLESVYDAVVITSVAGSILRQNREARHRFGLPDTEMLQTNILELISGATDEHLAAIVSQVGQQGRVCIEASCAPKPGGGFPAEITVNMIHYTGSSEGELCFFIRDISSRLETEEELAKERYLMDQLMERSPDFIYFKDRESRFLRVSRKWAEHIKLEDPAQALGKTDFDFHTPDHAQEAWEDEQSIMESGQPVLNKNERIVVPVGEMWISTTKGPLFAPDGTVLGTFGISRDITEQRNAETALGQKNAQLLSDLKMAREIQQAFLDHDVPRFPPGQSSENSALRFYRHYVTSGVIGGDFYDIKALSETTAGVLVCDVMGHDVRSALVMSSLHGLSEKMESVAADPGLFLTEINRSLRAILESAETLVFASAFYMVIDAVTGEVHFANAGHPRPLYEAPGDGTLWQLGSEAGDKGPALGLFNDAVYSTSSVSLERGGLVTLFTDGLYEVLGPQGESFGLDRLQALLAERKGMMPQLFYPSLIDKVRRFSGENAFDDDVCLVGVELARLLPRP